MKICLAGNFKEQLMPAFVKATPYRLQSMYFMEDWEIPYLNQFEFFMLDSGAFTFMSKKRTTNFDEYVAKYIDFINKNNIDNFIELDIDSIVGLKKVEEYRDLINKETGKKCIPVWHRNRGIQYFKDCCKEYPYVAIGGLVVNEYENVNGLFDMFPYFISYAHHCGAKIHGLGFTRFDKLHNCHFDSVDSTSWLSDSRYGRGSTMDVRSRKVVGFDIKNSRNVHYSELNENSLERWKHIIEYYRCFC